MEHPAMPLIPAATRRLPIQVEARALLTNPELAAAAGTTARRFAWFIEISARGGAPRQARHVANQPRCPK
ncbi:hypothetical protein [Paracoccus sp. ME4]|uniref:hypothetical protein n=1 Tax=Paracoccus sp. ME4 TaxID=3138066 RepID=UPI00398B024D